MQNIKLFIRAFLLLVLVGVMEYFAEIYYLHWNVWWYDVIMHFLGGACAGTAFIFFYYKFFKFSQFEKITAIKYTFYFVFLIGVLWEIYELLHGDTKFSDGIFFVRDTVSDLIIDSCGGFFATLLSFKQFGVNDRI
jgi:hypothetical protein